MKVVIDGDSFIWKNEIIEFLIKYNIKVIIVMNIAHYSKNINPYAEVIYVDNRPQETDIKIMNIVKDDDIVLTADSGLSYFFSGKRIFVINPRGKILNTKFSDIKIETIHIEKKLRRSKNRVKIKGPKKYSKEDLLNLQRTLKKIILKKMGLQLDTTGKN